MSPAAVGKRMVTNRYSLGKAIYARKLIVSDSGAAADTSIQIRESRNEAVPLSRLNLPDEKDNSIACRT